MNRTNKPAFKPASVSDDEIHTALIVLDDLREELKAHTKRRMDRIPDNVAWDAKATHVDFELRGHLSSERIMQLETKVGTPSKKEEHCQRLCRRQGEIEEQFDQTKNQAPSQVETESSETVEHKTSEGRKATEISRSLPCLARGTARRGGTQSSHGASQHHHGPNGQDEIRPMLLVSRRWLGEHGNQASPQRQRSLGIVAGYQ